MDQAGSAVAQGDRGALRKRRPSLVDAACEHIRASILSGTHWPGAQLPTKLIDFLGVRLVPPRPLYLRRGQAYAGASYKAVISSEHEAILGAIIHRDPERARIAARAHMSGSLKRHRELHDFMSANSPKG